MLVIIRCMVSGLWKRVMVYRTVSDHLRLPTQAPPKHHRDPPFLSVK